MHVFQLLIIGDEWFGGPFCRLVTSEDNFDVMEMGGHNFLFEIVCGFRVFLRVYLYFYFYFDFLEKVELEGPKTQVLQQW